MDALSFESNASEAATMSKQITGINQVIVNQLNTAGAIDAAIAQSLLVTPPTTSETLAARITNLLASLLSVWLSFFAQPIQCICSVLSGLRLQDLSLSVQQMDVRAEQVAVLVRQTAALQTRRLDSYGRIDVYSTQYTSFFNTVWLILNDITIGYTFGNFLCDNHDMLARLLRTSVEDILISLPQYTLRWLDSWPGGLKLNTELSRFYSGAFVDLVDVWGGVLRHVIFPHLPTIVYVFGLVSSFGALISKWYGGMTMAIALLYDMLVLLTLHIYVCYVIAGMIYKRVLWATGSLWRLFRGKRFNILRNRTDSWEYDIDQLLFGTILFTLLAFLFPTVLAYYALFALLRLATIVIQASLEMQLAFMNHFPLFALVLRVKDPWRLPGGLYFEFVKVTVTEIAPGSGADGSSSGLTSSEHPPTSLIPILKNQPATLGMIFFQYTRLWARLASHYNPLRLFKSVLLGTLLVPIPRHEIRYDKVKKS
ncbi:N-acetylglucosaminyl transferase component-domain-containing protein [Rhodocollybia butyracea]|uniref:N-acetylglucosaminyl transferase component-domain-containing protein n=1 Tax=Rhodocollybia butyracea TaxID=206335 RepID=A0A9P5Q096_9AGAR|nr:N-acetylglucosaminyl transferase component-domain-containing protein [Rhodocollybia butyracea]